LCSKAQSFSKNSSTKCEGDICHTTICINNNCQTSVANPTQVLNSIPQTKLADPGIMKISGFVRTSACHALIPALFPEVSNARVIVYNNLNPIPESTVHIFYAGSTTNQPTEVPIPIGHPYFISFSYRRLSNAWRAREFCMGSSIFLCLINLIFVVEL